MDNNELIAELLKELTKDVAALKIKVEKLPTQAPADYGARIENLTKAVQEVQKQLESPPAGVDSSAITARLDRIDYQSRQRPEYKMSQYVQYGAYAFGLMVVLVMGLTWYGLSWKRERDDYARSYNVADWRLRYLKQADPAYYQVIEGKFNQDANGVGRWIEEQEQADQKREAARQAAEQAAALTKQANQLEGKKNQAQ